MTMEIVGKRTVRHFRETRTLYDLSDGEHGILTISRAWCDGKAVYLERYVGGDDEERAYRTMRCPLDNAMALEVLDLIRSAEREAA